MINDVEFSWMIEIAITGGHLSRLQPDPYFQYIPFTFQLIPRYVIDGMIALRSPNIKESLLIQIIRVINQLHVVIFIRNTQICLSILQYVALLGYK